MTAIRYNPLTYRDSLVKTGMNEITANVIAQQQEEIISVTNEQLITRDYLNDYMEKFELKVLLKVGAMMVIQTGLIVSVLGFMMKHT